LSERLITYSRHRTAEDDVEYIRADTLAIADTMPGCPFCGNPDAVISECDKEHYLLDCAACTDGPRPVLKSSAAELWARRAPAIGQQADSGDRYQYQYPIDSRTVWRINLPASAHLSATNSGTEGASVDDCAAFSDAVLFGTAPAPQAAPELPTMRAAFRTTTLSGPQDLRSYQMVFTFASFSDLEKADNEWRAVFAKRGAA
jgi:hypothetical protein